MSGVLAFAVAAPTLWNKLPLVLRSAPDLSSFKRELKGAFTLAVYSPDFRTFQNSPNLIFGCECDGIPLRSN